ACMWKAAAEGAAPPAWQPQHHRSCLLSILAAEALDLAVRDSRFNSCSNYTNFTREVEHSNTAVYFCDGMHNNRQFALKFYASNEDFMAEMMAYKELGDFMAEMIAYKELMGELFNFASAFCLVCMISMCQHSVPVVQDASCQQCFQGLKVLADTVTEHSHTVAAAAAAAAGPSSKFVPVLEMTYPGSSSYPTSVLV
ncbi:hypothetical protein DAPPUDRAFT_125524, partial [Daphnia pulex]